VNPWNQLRKSWLNRLKANCQLFKTDGTPLDLPNWLQAHNEAEVDAPILLDKHAKLSARLVAKRVSAQA
jgi:hypothetical protein